MRKRLAAYVCSFLLALVIPALQGCSDSIDDENDIFVTNASGCKLERITLDGVDKGGILAGQVRKFDNVTDGVHTLLAFQKADDTAACDSHSTPYLDGDDDDYWTIYCDCD